MPIAGSQSPRLPFLRSSALSPLLFVIDRSSILPTDPAIRKALVPCLCFRLGKEKAENIRLYRPVHSNLFTCVVYFCAPEFNLIESKETGNLIRIRRANVCK